MVERRKGLCSTFLANLNAGDQVYVKIRPGTFRFDARRSQVLIGPGTGIAPFRSFVADLHAKDPTHAKSIVFFGCRSPDKDYYFQTEWPAFSDCTVFTAFSRPENESQKEYVQDKIKQFGEQIWQLLEDGKCKFIFFASTQYNHNHFDLAQVFVAGRGMLKLKLPPTLFYL